MALMKRSNLMSISTFANNCLKERIANYEKQIELAASTDFSVGE